MTAREKQILWEFKELNVFLQLISKLFLLRKDETVIRRACNIMLIFENTISKAHRKQLAEMHSKSLKEVFRKMSKVATYYTQAKLLEVVHKICCELDDGGAKTICETKIVEKSGQESAEKLVLSFQQIKQNQFLKVSFRENLSLRSNSILSFPDIPRLPPAFQHQNLPEAKHFLSKGSPHWNQRRDIVENSDRR